MSCDRLGCFGLYQRYGTTTESAPGHAAAEDTMIEAEIPMNLCHRIQFDAADLIIFGEGAVAFIHQLSKTDPISRLKGRRGLPGPRDFRDDVPGPLEQRGLYARVVNQLRGQIPIARFAQLIQGLGALLSSGCILTVGQRMPHVGVCNQETNIPLSEGNVPPSF